MTFVRNRKHNFNYYGLTGTTERVPNGFAFGQLIETIQRCQSLDHFIVHINGFY